MSKSARAFTEQLYKVLVCDASCQGKCFAQNGSGDDCYDTAILLPRLQNLSKYVCLRMKPRSKLATDKPEKEIAHWRAKDKRETKESVVMRDHSKAYTKQKPAMAGCMVFPEAWVFRI